MAGTSRSNWPRLRCRGSCSEKSSASSMGCGRPLCRHDGGPSSRIQVARQDRSVLWRSQRALTVRNGHGAEFLIAKSARSRADHSLSLQLRAEFVVECNCATLVGDWEEPNGESRLIVETLFAKRWGCGRLLTIKWACSHAILWLAFMVTDRDLPT